MLLTPDRASNSNPEMCEMNSIPTQLFVTRHTPHVTFHQCSALFKKFKEGFSKTVSAIATKTHGLFGGRKIDAASLDELEEALYTADFGVETTNEILAEIKKAYGEDKDLQGRQAAEIGAAVLRRVLVGSEGSLNGATCAVSGTRGESRSASRHSG